MKTYDCFTFFNELDVLEIRLREMYDTVDHFVIAEANMSHSGKPKDYILLDNWERFKPWADKIIRVQVDDFPDTKDSWVREKYQRYSLSKGLPNTLAKDDLIITSDLDEVPRAEAIEMIKEDENDYDRYVLGMPMFQFRMNYMKIFERTRQCSIMVAKGRCYTNGNQEREYTFPWNPKPRDMVTVDHGGWHFTYFGDDDHAVTKIQNFAHTETDVPRFTTNKLTIDYMVKNKFGLWGNDNPERFEYVKVDDYFPKCITDDLARWDHMIIPGAEFHVEDLYRDNE